MNIDELKSVASAIVAKQRGVLAADESSSTIKKRFDSIRDDDSGNPVLLAPDRPDGARRFAVVHPT